MLRLTLSPVLCTLVFALVFMTTGCAPQETPRFKMDHFRVWNVRPTKSGAWSVGVKGQFDDDFKKVHLTGPTHFANPVEKTLETGSKEKFEINDKRRHLAWYKLEQRTSETARRVEVANQFGADQTWDIGQPRYLLVPAQKEGYDPPEDIGHYQCYEVTSDHGDPDAPTTTDTLELRDQFAAQTNVAVGKPVFFCVPVKKKRPGEPTGPRHLPNTHLAVYEITKAHPTYLQGKPVVFDQFLPDEGVPLEVEESIMLCVPSKKRRWDEMGRD